MLNFPSFFNAQAGAYEIEQSLRFDGTAYLSRTPSTTGNNKTGTVSMWFKKSYIQKGLANQLSLLGFTSGGAPGLIRYRYQFDYIEHNAGANGTALYGMSLLAEHRDPSAWMHLVWTFDYTNASAAERMRIYINGVRQATNTYNPPPQNSGGTWNLSGVLHQIGRQSPGEFQGYMAEIYNIDGTALEPTSFGEFDDNGVWRPIEVSGLTYGTNGFYLKFDPSATNGVGHDHSGSGNHWTATNFTTSGTGTDVMSDTPTTNYCTWNPLTIRNGSGTMSLTEGNLKFGSTASTTYGSILATIAPTSGKYYCELTFEGTKSSNYNRELFGIVPIANWQTNTRVDVHQIPGSLVYESNGTSSLAHQGTGSVANTQSYGVAWDENSNIGIAIDFDTPSLTFYVDGSSQGTFPYSMTAGEAYAIFAVDWSNFVEISAFILNAGQRAFAYTPPTGYKALNTANLPAPTVKDGSDNFNTVLYTGTGVDNRAITGVGFQPDWVWLKPRSVSDNHVLQDVVRGAQKQLFTNSTDQEFSATTQLKSFDSDGFTLGTDSGVNGSGRTFAAWNWLAGGSVSADNNTDGSITSTVSANPSAGFSIVSWTGTGNSETVGHGLGVAPSFYILKSRDNAEDWAAYFTVVDGSLDYIALNTANAKSDSGLTAPTSTVIYRGTADANNEKMIAYCFTEVPGYSSIGSFVGNGSTDGPFCFTGFRPAFVIYKNTVSGYWNIRDSARNPFNPNNNELYPNVPDTENTHSSTRYIDFLSNGFKVRSGSGPVNGSGNTIIYMAFAEFPMGGSGVSPATAR